MASEPLVFVTRTKTFEIADYSIAKSISNRNSIESERFSVGGYDWVIQFYPQGINESVSDYVSVFVKLVTKPFKTVQAMYSIRLEGITTPDWSTTMPASTSLTTFSSRCWARGYNTYIEKSVFDSSYYLKDDTLSIKCTLWVACNHC